MYLGWHLFRGVVDTIGVVCMGLIMPFAWCYPKKGKGRGVFYPKIYPFTHEPLTTHSIQSDRCTPASPHLRICFRSQPPPLSSHPGETSKSPPLLLYQTFQYLILISSSGCIWSFPPHTVVLLASAGNQAAELSTNHWQAYLCASPQPRVSGYILVAYWNSG